MMNYTRDLFLVLMICILGSCESNKKFVGLWQVEKVKFGEQEMTPVAKWTRLNKDHTQESGNGWFQHSVGFWELDLKQQEIGISSTNGMIDEYGGFSVNFENGKMLWNRKEEGQLVEVTLIKIEKIPQAPANQLLGVWKLVSDKGEALDNVFPFLFIRWDQIVVLQTQEGDRKYGMYKTHGHKREIQVIHYEDPLRSEIWNYSLDGDSELMLSLNKDGEAIHLIYERVNIFPN